MGPDDEIYGDPAERRRLVQEWSRIDRQFQALRELPVGDVDPAQRERLLLDSQDRIEHARADASRVRP